MDLTLPIVIVLLVLIAILVVVYIFNSRDDVRFRFDIGGLTPKVSGGSDDSRESSTRARLLGQGVLSGGIIAVLLARLWSLQLLSSEDYAEQAESNRTRTIYTSAPRGRILDRRGEEIVSNRASLTVVAESDVASDTVEVQLLANLIGMPAAAVRRNILDTTEGVQSGRKVATDVSRRVVAFVGEHPSLFEGVSIEQRTARSYPNGTMACHLVGYTGTITTEQLEANQESTDPGTISYRSGDTVGQAGVEYQYESVLQGVRGEQTVYVDADGNVLTYASSVAARAGSDVLLTIDTRVQEAAEASLVKVIDTVRATVSPTCDAGSVVAMDVTNGEILAMASAPTFSPNIFVGGISSDDWTELQSDEADNPLMNRSISGQYPSASTIKPLTALAALKNGMATSESSYYCTGYWTGFGTGFGMYCWQRSGHGTMNVQTGITYSCDVVFYEIGKAFWSNDNPTGMQETFKEWGLGSITNIDLPGEGSGRVPDPEWKSEYYSSYSDEDREWKAGDYANIAIGQGDILVTPLQMACAYAGIATGGTIPTPHVLKSIKPAVGSGSVVEYEQSVLRSIEVDSDDLELVRTGMRGVIDEEQEYVTMRFETLGVSAAGKSGTAERSNENPCGWFVAYAPVEDPKYVVASAVENSTWGSDTAMYIVRDVLGALFNSPDTNEMGTPSSSSSE